MVQHSDADNFNVLPGFLRLLVYFCIFDESDSVHPLDDIAKDSVLAIQPRRRHCGYVKL
jgi:hypothetical protein